MITKNNQEFSLTQLSDGEKLMIAMVGDIARRLAIANPGLDDPLQGEGVVMIDEIELHLHPKWQRMIIPRLTKTFPNLQFIVTTHSPQVIGEVKDGKVFLLWQDEDSILAEELDYYYGWDSNRILEELMETPHKNEEIEEKITDLYRLIDKNDIEGAKKLRQELGEIIGHDESSLVEADTSITLRESLK